MKERRRWKRKLGSLGWNSKGQRHPFTEDELRKSADSVRAPKQDLMTGDLNLSPRLRLVFLGMVIVILLVVAIVVTIHRGAA